ncbi:MAG: redoxin domain-containing protein [Gammaproteobacteria bacterium]|nr:redoxin domain-containing protein [Gammaproteobacteria bacterium]NVK87498.1 redoxin domain-containing protein [Gammaproteobacteria bacterium]
MTDIETTNQQSHARIGWTAPDFSLPGVDSQQWNLGRSRGAMGLVVVFIANDCPYVAPILDKLPTLNKLLLNMGVGMVAVNPSNPSIQPENALPYMRSVARQSRFDFPYLVDDKQILARAFGAQITPEFFGFNALMELQYHGRLGLTDEDEVGHCELIIAMRQIALTGQGPQQQFAASGCRIKYEQADAAELLHEPF